ncbi:MAG: pyruvate formate-lyase-activating protein [Candidatus Scatovivens sp.]
MEQLTAKIHSFESFGTVDGPGIRFVVFMQGCPLKCKYCHNRDTWDYNAGTEYTIDDIIKKILKAKTYIDASDGGVTISGGEPLLQADFIIELFKELKKFNIHTAIDTAGSIKINQKIETLLSYTDLVLLDIKHINNEKCIFLTGHSNENTLDFARYLSDKNIPTWIRQVIIPGLTDNKDDLIELKNFISTLQSVKNIELLPYHNLGQYKWENLNIKYPLEGYRVATNDDIETANKILGI